MKKAAIIMGSDSDLPVVSKAFDVLNEFKIPYEVHVFSAHRTPQEAKAFTESAKENGFGVLIAAAGMAAHLAGALAANTVLPVIGIPVKSAALGGMDALLSTVMMPAGIPVATVAIDGAKNAAYLAAQILAVEDEELYRQLLASRAAASKSVLKRTRKFRANIIRNNTDSTNQNGKNHGNETIRDENILRRKTNGKDGSTLRGQGEESVRNER